MEFIGKGSYGDVYKDKDVAVKKFKHFEHFLDEYQFLKMLDDHPNIVKILGYNRLEKTITMELGKYTLKHLIYSDDEKPDFIIDNMISAVKYLHENNIAHLDIHPENFIVFEDCLKLIDFSMSQRKSLFDHKGNNIKDEDIGHCVCIINYRSPELICQHSDRYPALIDVWSLGCVIYEVLFMERLFDNFLLKEGERLIMIKLISNKIGKLPEKFIREISEGLDYTHLDNNNIIFENELKDHELKNLLFKMLQIDPLLRCNMKDISIKYI